MTDNQDNKIELEGFEKICGLESLKEKQGRRFIINDTEVAVFKVEGEVFALSNVCPHQHTTQIYDGYIEDGCVVCPVHGWMFNLKTGRMPTNSKGLDPYPVVVKDNHVYLKVIKKEFKW